MPEQVSVSTSTVTVTVVPQQVLAANSDRKYLSLQNKSAENSIAIKIGANFVQSQNEVQRIAFAHPLIPSAGSFKVNYGALATSAINYDAVASDVQTAIRTLTGLDTASVDGNFPDGFTITFGGDAADIALLTITENTLVSDDWNADEVQHIVFSAAPTVGTYKVKFGANKSAAINFNDNAAAVQQAIRLVTGLEAVTVAALSPEAGFSVTFTGSHADAAILQVTDSTLKDETVETDEIQEIYVNLPATEGTFKLQFGGQLTSELDFDATATEVQTALRALSTISDNTTVTGSSYQGEKQTMTYTVNRLEEFPYTISTPDDDYTYIPDGVPADKNEVVEALMATINAADDLFVASLGGTDPNQTLILTARTPGIAFTTEPTENVTEVETVANNRGLSVRFTGTDGYVDQELIQPYDVKLKRYGEELRMDVYAKTEGIAPANVTAVVSEVIKGVDNTALAATVTTPIPGIANRNEGTILDPGARMTMADSVFINDVWAACDDGTADLEIVEG